MISVILGTRPEIVKMSPIIRELDRRGEEFEVLHTGQHYSYSMDKAFFEQLVLPDPDVNLDVGSSSHAVMTGRIMEGLEKVLDGRTIGEALVQGDTNTVLGGALVCSKLHIRLGHVEAGLRSFDRRMPEEVNRIVADHLSDHLYAPTETSRSLLLREGIEDRKVHVTGNTVVDAVLQNLEIAKKGSDIMQRLGVSKDSFILATSHREENVDVPDRFKGILEGLSRVSKETGMDVVYPIHPRAKRRMEENRLRTDGVRTMDPLGYLDFLNLESNARLVLTDSGGVQEESCILRVPCVTLRDSTERPETTAVGGNVLAGTDPEVILGRSLDMLKAKRTWDNPFGDGSASMRIIDIAMKSS